MFACSIEFLSHFLFLSFGGMLFAKVDKKIFKKMYKVFSIIAVFFVFIFIGACSKKSHPSGSAIIMPINGISSPAEVKKSNEVVEKKTVAKAKPKAVFPQVITVNDSAARRSVDGRYYYDVLGHRYWRNNKDGKYYLFNKSMYKDDAFKKPD
jgi:hypothetical protein